MNRLNRKRLTFLSLSLAVPVILLCVFVVYPFWELIHMSFLEWDGVSSVRSLAGFDNYTQLFFKSPEFWQAFRNNLTYLLIHGIMMPVELVLAVMLSSRFKGSGFVKAIIFLPFIINGVGISYSFSYFFSPVEGGFNYILTRLGMEGLIHNWLSDPKIVNYVLASVSIWRYMGFHIVLFMACLLYTSYQPMLPERIRKLSALSCTGFQRYLIPLKTIIKAEGWEPFASSTARDASWLTPAKRPGFRPLSPKKSGKTQQTWLPQTSRQPAILLLQITILPPAPSSRFHTAAYAI